MMQLFRFSPVVLSSAFAGFLSLLLTGCSTPSSTDAAAPSGTAPIGTSDRSTDFLRVGDMVTINFSGVEVPPVIKHEERIRDDGNITLPYIGAVKAAGLTRAELQESILTNYVPRFYTRLTVNVGSEARWFYVQGQVKAPGRYPFAGEMTVSKCVAAAGDFTDFAKRGKVEITRANGKKEKVNWYDSQKDPRKDLPIYPGDLIFVPRRYL